MFARRIDLVSIIILVDYVSCEEIHLPSVLMINQSLSSSSSLYLCHLHRLNNSDNLFLQGYEIINGGQTGHVHHLLVYECSSKEAMQYSGLCGVHNARLMPELVYQHCQTRIILAWAQGGNRNYTYPIEAGLKFDGSTQLLLEVHFEPTVPRQQTIGVHLRFYPIDERPRYEIGVLTLGTLAQSTLFLPPRLDRIDLPTFCPKNCFKYFLENQSSINVFAILLHAHRRAIRIVLEKNRIFSWIDRNPFEFHRQKIDHFSKPYPKITFEDELSLICSYTTRNDSDRAIRGGHNSNDEMCQAFLYYYPKISSFPLCLSLPIYDEDVTIDYRENWTNERSQSAKDRLESNRRHLTMCGDSIDRNRSNLRTQIYEDSTRHSPEFSFVQGYLFFSSFYVIIVSILLLGICVMMRKTTTFFSFSQFLSTDE